MNIFRLHVRFGFALFASLALLSLAVGSGIQAGEPQGRSIHFRVTHPMKVVNGRCEEIAFSSEPKFTRNGSSLILASPVQVSVPVLSIRTGDANRDSHIVEALKYPKVSTIVISIDRARCDGTDCQIEGNLSVAGVTKSLLMKAAREDGTADVRIHGSYTVRMTDHGVKPPSLLFMAAEDAVLIEFDFRFPK